MRLDKNSCLGKAYERTLTGILTHSLESHLQSYTGENHDMWAEPEFTGKYVDICTKYYKNTGNKEYLNRAKAVIDKICEVQSEDGYIGGLTKKDRWENFDVWNQTFTVLGLLSYYSETKEKRALDAAEKCAVNIALHYMHGKGKDILDATNFGTQHISILLVLPKLYKITGKPIYRDFMDFIADKIKNSDLNFFEFENILELRSKKGIENFVVLMGMLEYAEIIGDDKIVESVKKYWQQVNDTQIRNTGNGTVGEFWTENGNAPALLGADIRPNENCVAVGWMELSLMLFYRDRNTKYLDAIEKSLFNHLLGSLSEDGTDFAYYQPNYGKKVSTTQETMYKCCRYRGFTFFAYLQDMLYYSDDSFIIPMIYQASEYEDEYVRITQKTRYPFDTKIHFDIKLKKDCNKKLKLKIPKWCKKYSLNKDYICCDGYVVLDCKDMNLEFNLESEVVKETGIIDGKEYVAYSKGPLLLAHETDCKKPLYTTDGYKFKDYASAGRENEYMVWIPKKQEG